MFGASLYIIACSARNRARVRLRRLREPRYLIGAIVGVAYMYFSFFGRLRGARSSAARNSARAQRDGTSPALSTVSALVASGPAFTGIALLLVTAVSWLVPFDSGLLDFSDAEVQFLFPAPVSRRQLLIHRMLRSQIGLLFGALILGIAVPSASGFGRLRMSVAMWTLLVTGKVYFTGVSLARTRLRSASARSRRVAWLPVAMLTTAIVIVAAAMTRAYLAAPPSSIRGAFQLVGQVALQPLPRVALWPFVAVTRPLFLFSASAGAYLAALAGSAVVLALSVAWVLKSDEAFQDAAAEVAERRKRQPHGQRAVSYHAHPTGWTLAPAGRPEMAFAWKAAMQTLRVVDKRGLARVAGILFVLTVAATSAGREGPAATLGGFAIAAALFTILMAPQIIRVDMRQDLRHLELLKTWPVKSSAVVRGELLWPGVFLTAIAWTMIAIAMTLSGTVIPKLGLVWRLGAGGAIAIVAPALVFAQLTIHNAVALVFPAWVPLGNQRTRGLDAMGQRLIMLGATWLSLVVMALPGALAGAIVWFALGRFFGPVALVPAAAVCTVAIALEVLLATEALGPAYERLDVMAVEPAE
jgi:ABC-2 type transport system permease protein